MTTRIGLIQTRTPATHASALAQLEPLVRQAADQGARFVATPEASNILQRDRSKLFAELQPLDRDPVVQRTRELASEMGLQILIGSALVRRPDGKCANRAVLIGPDGEVQATYDKIHMFDVDLPTGERHRESEVYTPGRNAMLAETEFGLVGLTICYDVRFPGLYCELAKAGAVAIAVPAAFTRPTGEAHWEVLLRARAIETGSYILAPAQGGFHEDGRGTWGHSMVVGPWGEVIARLDHDEPGVLMAEIDAERVRQARSAIPTLANVREFDLPELVG